MKSVQIETDINIFSIQLLCIFIFIFKEFIYGKINFNIIHSLCVSNHVLDVSLENWMKNKILFDILYSKHVWTLWFVLEIWSIEIYFPLKCVANGDDSMILGRVFVNVVVVSVFFFGLKNQHDLSVLNRITYAMWMSYIYNCQSKKKSSESLWWSSSEVN